MGTGQYWLYIAMGTGMYTGTGTGTTITLIGSSAENPVINRLSHFISRLHFNSALCYERWFMCACVCVGVFTRLHFSVDHIGFAGGFLVLYHWSTQQGLVLEDLNREGKHPVCLGTGLTQEE